MTSIAIATPAIERRRADRGGRRRRHVGDVAGDGGDGVHRPSPHARERVEPPGRARQFDRRLRRVRADGVDVFLEDVGDVVASGDERVARDGGGRRQRGRRLRLQRREARARSRRQRLHLRRDVRVDTNRRERQDVRLVSGVRDVVRGAESPSRASRSRERPRTRRETSPRRRRLGRRRP